MSIEQIIIIQLFNQTFVIDLIMKLLNYICLYKYIIGYEIENNHVYKFMITIVVKC